MKAIHDTSSSERSSSNENPPTVINNDLESSAEKVASTYNNQDETSIDEAVGIITNNIQFDSCLQLVTKTLNVTDAPTLNPFSFRAFFLGIGLSAFGAVIAEIFYFKPKPMPCCSSSILARA